MRRHKEQGFTLLELLVVLVIAGLALGVVAPRFSGLIPGVEFKSESRKMAALLRQARGLAIARGEIVSLRMSDDNRALHFSGRNRDYPLPESMELKVTADFSTLDGESILFYPDGSSNGGKLLLQSGERHSQVSVDWLSGRVISDE